MRRILVQYTEGIPAVTEFCRKSSATTTPVWRGGIFATPNGPVRRRTVRPEPFTCGRVAASCALRRPGDGGSADRKNSRSEAAAVRGLWEARSRATLSVACSHAANPCATVYRHASGNFAILSLGIISK